MPLKSVKEKGYRIAKKRFNEIGSISGFLSGRRLWRGSLMRKRGTCIDIVINELDPMASRARINSAFSSQTARPKFI